MKNKSRCRYLKKIFACCAFVFLFISISVPCFATGVYPTQDNTFAGGRILVPDDGWTYDNSSAIADIVEKAYNLNYFSAGVPVAVLSFMDYIAVLVVPSVIVVGTEPPIPGADFEGVVPPLLGVPRSNVYCDVEEESMLTSFVHLSAENSFSGQKYPMMMYYLNYDNTFSPAVAVPMLVSYNEQNPTESEFQLALGMVASYFCAKSDVIAVRFGDDDWRTPYADGFAETDSLIVDIGNWYDDQYQPVYVYNDFNYDLDIPSIITAIPNGAKQIINNVFGFEIFGINVAGLLSVLLIVAIVGFVVKWLMSR